MALFRTGLYVKDHQVEKVQVASTPIASYNGNVTGLMIPEIVAMINAIQASGTPAPDNVIPIYGRNGVIVNRCGTNLWDEETLNGYYSGSDGSLVLSSGQLCSKNFIPVKPNTNYYYKNISSIGEFIFYDIEGNFIKKVTDKGNAVITTPANCYNMNIDLGTPYGSPYNHDISINYPSTDTDYHAFVGNPYTQYFEGLLNGTYGFVDLGSLSWTKVLDKFRASQGQLGTKGGNVNVPYSMICTAYPVVAYGQTDSKDEVCDVDSAGNFRIKDTSFTGYATAFKTYMSGKYLIYELATASTPTITQAQIDTLLTAFDVDDKSVIIVFGQEVFGGYVNVNDGLLVITHANIASYNGESINEPWLSSMDEYSSGATPTTGAQVVYPLTTPIEVQLTPKQLEQLLVNNVFADTGNVAVKFYNVIR